MPQNALCLSFPFELTIYILKAPEATPSKPARMLVHEEVTEKKGKKHYLFLMSALCKIFGPNVSKCVHIYIYTVCSAALP